MKFGQAPAPGHNFRATRAWRRLLASSALPRGGSRWPSFGNFTLFGTPHIGEIESLASIGLKLVHRVIGARPSGHPSSVMCGFLKDNNK